MEVIVLTKEEECLRLLRSSIAKKAETKSKWTFSDIELNRLLKYKPNTIEKLTSIKGFPKGGKRVSAYGQKIVDIFNGIFPNDFKVEIQGDNLKVYSLKSKNRF